MFVLVCGGERNIGCRLTAKATLSPLSSLHDGSGAHAVPKVENLNCLCVYPCVY